MEFYSYTRKYDVVSTKNNEESEERNEIFNTVYFESNCVSIKSIHNKKKEHR